MKKILSILLSVAIILSCVSLVSFGATESENLLPPEISTFTDDGTSNPDASEMHEHLAYYGTANHFGTKTVNSSEDALRIGYKNYAGTGVSPMWLLGSYIRNYATQNAADKYIVYVALDVKGSINTADLIFRRFGADGNGVTYTVQQSASFLESTYTTVSGSFELTATEALAAQDTWYALCLNNISRPATTAAVLFDNVVLKITPVVIATPEPTVAPTPVPEVPLGLLPAEISTFTVESHVQEVEGMHEHLIFTIGATSHFSSRKINADSDALRIGYAQGVTSSNGSPFWLLGSYIRKFATENTADKYVVNVSMDVKAEVEGAINSATFTVRRFGSDTNSVVKNLMQGTFTNTEYTTLSGSFELTATEALAAQDTWYALGLDSIKRNAAVAAVLFDNVTLNITPVITATPEPTVAPTPVPETPIGLLPVEISTYTQGTGKVTHEHVEYFNYASHMHNQVISTDALCVNYVSGATSTQASPFWLLGSYIKNFATANSGDTYTVNVSMDVKGSVTSARLMLRRNGENVNGTKIDLTGVTTLSSTEYTTLSGTFTLTSAQALAAAADCYALCIGDIIRPSALAGIYFDNIVLTITANQKPAATPIGLLPVDISVFDVDANTDASALHDHLIYLNTTQLSSKAVNANAGALRVGYYHYASDYASPMWLLGSYIKGFAANNASYAYRVEVSMDVKGEVAGAIDSAKLAVRRFGDASDNTFETLTEDIALNETEYTTLSASFVLSASEAKNAEDTWYALCVMDLARTPNGQAKAVLFDNIVLKVTAVNSNKLEGATLDLGSTLTINYYADLDEDHKDAVLNVTRNGATVTVLGVYDETYKMYKFAYTGINPQCMVDNVAATLVLGEEELAVYDEYSVKAYLKNMINSSAEKLGISEAKFNALKELANDTLIYGREAQKHAKYNLTELATDGIEIAENDALTTENAPTELNKAVNNTQEENKVVSVTLNVSNTIKVAYRVKLTDKTLTVKVNGQEAELIATTKADEYFVYAPAVDAGNLNAASTITITDGEELISSVTYSANDYISYIAGKGTSSSTYDITSAVYNYGISAKAYNLAK